MICLNDKNENKSLLVVTVVQCHPREMDLDLNSPSFLTKVMPLEG